MRHFKHFVAIDWSGARGTRHKGIAVATCETGTDAPILVDPPNRLWSRTDICAWIIAHADTPMLIGMDFSFSAPWLERRSYLPGSGAPDTAKALWAWVDAQCDDEDLGAASLIEQHQRRHFYLGASDGVKSDYLYWRKCEAHYNMGGGGKASTVYDAIGAAQVSKASFAGMRLLHKINPHLPIWPFDPRGQSGAQLVEIYTTIAARAGGIGKGRSKLRDPVVLDCVLARLGSRPHTRLTRYDDHATDAIIGAAWLRQVCGRQDYWMPEGLDDESALKEGWTFGVN